MPNKKRVVIAVTGSSGAGTSTVQDAFCNVLRRENIKSINIEGDSFHRFNRQEMKVEVAKAEWHSTRTRQYQLLKKYWVSWIWC